MGRWTAVTLANTFPVSVFFGTQVQVWGLLGLNHDPFTHTKRKTQEEEEGQGVEGTSAQWNLNFSGSIIQEIVHLIAVSVASFLTWVWWILAITPATFTTIGVMTVTIEGPF